MSLMNNMNFTEDTSGGCGCGGHGKTGNCVCDTLAAVLAEQQQVAPIEEQDCETGCFRSLVSPAAVSPIGDTIPLILFNKEGQPQTAFGNVGSMDSTKPCFTTVFFKVVALDTKTQCATLQLLKPDNPICTDKHCCVPLKEICEVKKLTRTKDCITVDCSCFCSIQCFDPTLLDPDVA